MNRRLKLAAPTVAAALVLAACGTDGDDTADDPVEAAADEMTDDMTDDEMADDMSDEMTDDMDDMTDDEMSDTDDMTDEEMSDTDDMADEEMSDEMMMDGSEPVAVAVTIENIGAFPVTHSGSFAVPAGADEPAPVLPGDAYEFELFANPGDRLTFATMFVQSNDWFFAPDPAFGIELFDADGTPVSGDVTDQIVLWDGGTEVDQEPGAGADQAPRQGGPDTGDADADPSIRRVERNAADYVSVTVIPGDPGAFTVRVENVSADATTPTPIAPGVFAAHTADAALFIEGEADAGNGLEALAEDGDPSGLAAWLAGITGVSGPLAPGAFAVHAPAAQLFTLGEADAGIGLEALAEDGDPSGLVAALSDLDVVSAADAFAVPSDAAEPGPAFPGSSYGFSTEIAHGQVLSFATMLVQSNDWVIATPAGGLSLVDGEGNLTTGDITADLVVLDAATEIDQPFGFGPDQAPRQAGPDTGADDTDGTVRVVDGLDASRYVRVTVTAG